MTSHQLGSRSALLAFIGAAVSISFSGTAAGSQMIVNPDVLRFGEVVVGATETLPVNVVNSGSTSVTVSSITSSLASYTVIHPTLPMKLWPGASLAIKVVFKPRALGSALAEIAINRGAAYLKVSGAGQSSRALYATPDSIGFGTVPAGSSESSFVAIRNGSNSAVTIATTAATGSGFSVAGLSLPLTLNPGQSFTFKIVFSPKSSETVWGRLGARNAVGQDLLAILLNGTGSPELSVSPSTLSFGNVTVGSNETKTGTLTATGGSVTIHSDSTTSSEFTISGISLPATIAAGHRVSYKVTFAPKAGGAASGKLAFKTSTAGITATESVSGTGLAKHTVDLRWNASTSKVSGYNIYRGTTSGGPYSKLNSSLDPDTSYADRRVSANQTYYYVTTAVNSRGRESRHSNEARVKIP